jgi:hypothetical protein
MCGRECSWCQNGECGDYSCAGDHTDGGWCPKFACWDCMKEKNRLSNVLGDYYCKACLSIKLQAMVADCDQMGE